MSQLIGREHSRRIAWQQSRNMVHIRFLVYRNCLIFAVALMTACCKTSKNTRYCMRLSRIVRQPWSLSILLSLQFVDLSLTRKKASLSMVLKTLIVLEKMYGLLFDSCVVMPQTIQYTPLATIVPPDKILRSRAATRTTEAASESRKRAVAHNLRQTSPRQPRNLTVYKSFEINSSMRHKCPNVERKAGHKDQ
ncbi:hypothetical protein METSCH_C07920 [Metschnikowia aff. pulcherrima]|uniref:Uncharacterized protein n=1 Tax=Metschnikowia aff. pulcherrima TaxID=2163413 RepID=A0A4P6XS90_9ASCO|nr:hypothetical protein METSCH_C07920 [Metschnikowia aff. pulcherrima]